jgi:transglutaminase-like putative cysteine protease
MLYDVALRLIYEYQAPADFGRYVLRCQPMDIPGQQRVIACSLLVDPQPIELTTRVDFFGNTSVEVAVAGSHDSALYEVRARVERNAVAPSPAVRISRDELRAELEASTDLAARSPLHFLSASPRAEHSGVIARYALAQVGKVEDVAESVERLGRKLHRYLAFDPTATTVTTSAADAFQNGRGVCQDFTHIMIIALRSLGIPAGYVSGFLRTKPPPGEARLDGADAMHAWVMAWCGQATGWVEFDPTNDMWAGEDHIVVARGRDYGDVAPIIGLTRTSGGQEAEQQVDVKPVE